jgi:hypothetical protein
MRYLFLSLTALVVPIALAGTLRAQEEQGKDPAGRPPRNPEVRQRLLEEFDADGDGQLSEEERQKAREAMRERRGNLPGGPGRGAGPMADPNALFDKFDANGDGQLSREEFAELSKVVRNRMRQQGPPAGGPGRAGQGRRGGPPAGDLGGPVPPGDIEHPLPPGPGKIAARRGAPLRNPIDGPPGPPEGGPPPGPGDAEQGPPAAGRPWGPPGGPGFDGPPGGEGPRGPRMGPDPNRLFDRFDENGDDQLSREEFLKLTKAMREMRGRFEQGGPPFGGPQGGRPGRRGPGGRGGADAPPGPPPAEMDPAAETDAPPVEGETF